MLNPLGSSAASLWNGRRRTARFATRRLGTGESAAIGTSKLGGAPDLPLEVAWPTWNGPDGKRPSRPLTFFAQVQLDGVGSYVGRPFAAAGALLFFADFDLEGDGGIFGLYDDELLGARAIFVEPGTPVGRAKTPPELRPLPEAVVAPILTTTFGEPNFEEVEDDVYDAFDEFVQALAQLDATHAPEGFVVAGNHQLGGHPRFIQHPVEEEVVQAHYGAYRREGGFDAARWEEVKPDVGNWTVLFQFDSDDSLDLMWGDVGTLWWAAPTAPVAAGDFSSTRFNFQCS